MKKLVISLALVAITGVSAWGLAQESSRYEYIDTANGVVRVDRDSGDVSRCLNRQDASTCRTIADDRSSLMGAIDELDGRLAALEERLNGPAILGPSDNVEQDTPQRGNHDDEGSSLLDNLPSEEELDEFIDLSEQIFRRFFDVVGDLRQSLESEL
jgi:hypothetical protein